MTASKSFLSAGLAAALAITTATSAAAATVITGGVQTPVSDASPNFMQGYDFVALNNLSLTALGFWDGGANGLPETFQMGLWDTATQQLMASAFIDSTDVLDLSVTVAGGNWRYETLGAAVPLLSGKTYTLGWQTGPNGMSGADILLINYPTLTSDPNVSVANRVANPSRFQNTGAFTFPTNSVSDARFRGNVNAQFVAMDFTAVPEPSTAITAMLLLGTAVMSRWRVRGTQQAL